MSTTINPAAPSPAVQAPPSTTRETTQASDNQADKKDEPGLLDNVSWKGLLGGAGVAVGSFLVFQYFDQISQMLGMGSGEDGQTSFLQKILKLGTLALGLGGGGWIMYKSVTGEKQSGYMPAGTTTAQTSQTPVVPTTPPPPEVALTKKGILLRRLEELTSTTPKLAERIEEYKKDINGASVDVLAAIVSNGNIHGDIRQAAAAQLMQSPETTAFTTLFQALAAINSSESGIWTDGNKTVLDKTIMALAALARDPATDRARREEILSNLPQLLAIGNRRGAARRATRTLTDPSSGNQTAVLSDSPEYITAAARVARNDSHSQDQSDAINFLRRQYDPSRTDERSTEKNGFIHRTLVACLGCTNEAAKKAAAEALSAIDLPQNLNREDQMSILRVASADPQCRGELFGCVAKIYSRTRDDRALEILLDASKDTNPNIARAGAAALNKINGASLTDISFDRYGNVIALANNTSTDPIVREHLFSFLGMIHNNITSTTDKTAILNNIVTSSKKTDEPEIAMAAIRTLIKIDPAHAEIIPATNQIFNRAVATGTLADKRKEYLNFVGEIYSQTRDLGLLGSLINATENTNEAISSAAYDALKNIDYKIIELRDMRDICTPFLKRTYTGANDNIKANSKAILVRMLNTVNSSDASDFLQTIVIQALNETSPDQAKACRELLASIGKPKFDIDPAEHLLPLVTTIHGCTDGNLRQTLAKTLVDMAFRVGQEKVVLELASNHGVSTAFPGGTTPLNDAGRTAIATALAGKDYSGLKLSNDQMLSFIQATADSSGDLRTSLSSVLTKVIETAPQDAEFRATLTQKTNLHIDAVNIANADTADFRTSICFLLALPENLGGVRAVKDKLNDVAQDPTKQALSRTIITELAKASKDRLGFLLEVAGNNSFHENSRAFAIKEIGRTALDIARDPSSISKLNTLLAALPDGALKTATVDSLCKVVENSKDCSLETLNLLVNLSQNHTDDAQRKTILDHTLKLLENRTSNPNDGTLGLIINLANGLNDPSRAAEKIQVLQTLKKVLDKTQGCKNETVNMVCDLLETEITAGTNQAERETVLVSLTDLIENKKHTSIESIDKLAKILDITANISPAEKEKIAHIISKMAKSVEIKSGEDLDKLNNIFSKFPAVASGTPIATDITAARDRIKELKESLDILKDNSKNLPLRIAAAKRLSDKKEFNLLLNAMTNGPDEITKQIAAIFVGPEWSRRQNPTPAVPGTDPPPATLDEIKKAAQLIGVLSLDDNYTARVNTTNALTEMKKHVKLDGDPYIDARLTIVESNGPNADIFAQEIMDVNPTEKVGIKKLQELLSRTTDPKVKLVIGLTLARSTDEATAKSGVQAIASLLSSEDKTISHNAMSELDKLSKDGSITAGAKTEADRLLTEHVTSLTKIIDKIDGPLEDRAKAAGKLVGSIREKEITDRLTNADPSIRLVCAVALGEGNNAAKKELAKTLYSDQEPLRAFALKTIKGRGDAAIGEAATEVLNAIPNIANRTAVTTDTGDKEKRLRALEALGNLGLRRQDIIDKLAHYATNINCTDKDLRLQAVLTLEKIGGDKALEVLNRLTGHDLNLARLLEARRNVNNGIQADVLEAARQTPPVVQTPPSPTPVVDPIQTILDAINNKENKNGRLTAIKDFPRTTTNQRVTDALAAILRDNTDDNDVRLAALDKLIQIGARDPIEACASGNPNEYSFDLRNKAFRHLLDDIGNLKLETAICFLESSTNDSSCPKTDVKALVVAVVDFRGGINALSGEESNPASQKGRYRALVPA